MSQADIRLSTHFMLSEFIVSQTAARQGIDNTPSQMVVDNLRRLCADILEPIRERFACPVVISSGFRCPALNAAVGGVPGSQHVIGQAADILVPGYGDPLRVAQFIKESTLLYDQCIYEYDSWTHVSWSPTPRRMDLTIDANGTRGGLG
jgi:zinc D-Ala-D-Ala carboxypeptidase